MGFRTVGTWFFRWVAPLMVLACAGWFIYAMGSRSKPNRRKAPPRKSIPVEVVHAEQHTGQLDIVASGVAIPYREVRLSSQVGGEVIFKSDALSPGQYVNKGDVLLKIDPQDFQIEVARLEQELAKSKVELDRLKVDRENAERLLEINRKVVELRRTNVKRLEKLRRANASTMSEMDATELAMLTAIEQSTMHQNTLRQFPNQTKALEMTRDLVALQLKRAELDLARTTIVAPFSGVVIANHVEQNGSLVAGAQVATLEDTSMIEVRSNLRAEDLAFIQGSVDAKNPKKHGTTASQQSVAGEAYRLPPIRATVEFQRAGRTWKWDGVLSRQDGLGIDQKTRTMPVRIRVDRPTKNSGMSNSLDDPPSVPLMRGMFVRVKLHCKPQQPLLVIPESVLRPGKTVWLMRNDKLHILALQIARIESGQAFIEAHSGLGLEDEIIRSPVPNARQGLTVSLMKEKGQPKAAANAKAANAKAAASAKGDAATTGDQQKSVRS